jgi:predicted nuclease with TOPRIM domain
MDPMGNVPVFVTFFRYGICNSSLANRSGACGGKQRRWTMNTKDEYVAKMKAKLEEWSAQIDQLEAKSRELKAQATQEQQERIAELKRRREEAAAKLKEMQEASADSWESLKSGVEQIWEDTKLTLQQSKDAFAEGFQGSAEHKGPDS